MPDYENFCKEHAQATHFMVDCDRHQELKFYFDCRVEPQFLVLLNGSEMKRQIGFNFDLVSQHIKRVSDLHYKEFKYEGLSRDTTGDAHSRFYDNFDMDANTNEYERDTFKMRYDSQMDKHR
jgi:hypothetical protein